MRQKDRDLHAMRAKVEVFVFFPIKKYFTATYKTVQYQTWMVSCLTRIQRHEISAAKLLSNMQNKDKLII